MYYLSSAKYKFVQWGLKEEFATDDAYNVQRIKFFHAIIDIYTLMLFTVL